MDNEWYGYFETHSYDHLQANSTASVAQPLTFTVTPSPDQGWHVEQRHPVFAETAPVLCASLILVWAYDKARSSTRRGVSTSPR